MKTSPLDYMLSGTLITLLLGLSAGLVWCVWPWSSRLLGNYHVLFDLALLILAYGLLSALAVRLLLRIRPIPDGSHGMDDPVFTQWKLVTIIYRMGQGALAPMVPVFLKPLVEALYGARIGPDVALGGTIDDPYRVTLGAGAVLGNASLVSGNYIAGGRLICGSVTIGAGATIGANAVVFPDVEIGAGATVAGGAYVMPGARIPAGETWRGNPARKWLQQPGQKAGD